METAAKKIYTACGKSKACVKKSTKALCAWDSGSVTVMVTDRLTRTRVGTQCPGSTWKKYHPHRLERKQIIWLCFVGGLKLNFELIMKSQKPTSKNSFVGVIEKQAT